MTPREQKLTDALQLTMRMTTRVRKAHEGVMQVTRNADRLALANELDGVRFALQLIEQILKDLLEEKPVALLAEHPRPWEYREDHPGAGFGDVLDARYGRVRIDTATVARLMDEHDAYELIEFANAQV